MQDQLAIMPSGNTFVSIWSPTNKEVQKIDSEFKTQEFTTMVGCEVAGF